MSGTHIDLPAHSGEGPLRVLKTCNNPACAKNFLIIEMFKPISIAFEGACPDCRELVRFEIEAEDLRKMPAIELPSSPEGQNRHAVVCANASCGKYFVIIELMKPIAADFNGICPDCGEAVPFKLEGVSENG